MKAAEREAALAKIRDRAEQREAQLRRLSDPNIRCLTFSGLKVLKNPELVEQLRIRKVVDGRRESDGKALICTPPSSGGRTWLVLKLQGLLLKEFQEKNIANNPNDLSVLVTLGVTAELRARRGRRTTQASGMCSRTCIASSCVHQ